MIRTALSKMFRLKPKTVTRFAPSPTGLLHSGNYRTAVFAYLFAKQRNGRFILRIEDTDKARSKPEFEANILESLKWLGLEYDEMYRQSERTEIYRERLEKLIQEGKAYVSNEDPGPDVGEGERRREVIRFKNPNKKVIFKDVIRGDIEFDTTELGDFVIAKSITEPIFHFVVVVDDFLMGVTHVIRGEDHISNTPRHILIQEALGAPTPTYAHLPLVLAHDRSKLSKRHGAQPMTYYRDQGYLSQSLLNYMSLLGWNPGTDQEIFTLDGLMRAFDLSKVQKGGAIFNEEKLRWINKEHLKLVPKPILVDEIKRRIESSARAKELGWDVQLDLVERLSPTVLERINIYSDIDKMLDERDFDYYFADPDYDVLSLTWKEDKDPQRASVHLQAVKDMLGVIPDSRWNDEDIKSMLWPYAEQHGRGNVLWPFRYSLSGKDKSPNPFTLASILGKETSLRRIDAALKKCAEYAIIK